MARKPKGVRGEFSWAADPSILEICADIYRAATDDDRWSRVLAGIVGVVGGRIGLFSIQNRATRTLDLALFEGANPDFVKDYVGHYAAHDFWLVHGPSLPTGEVVRGSQLFPISEMPGTTFYEEMLRPNGVKGMLGAIIAGSQSSGDFAYMSVVQGLDREDFSEHEVALMQGFMPHLQNAWSIRRRLYTAEAGRARSLEALDQLPHGVLLYTCPYRADFVNRRAREMAAEADGLTLRGQRLALADKAADAELDAALRGALLTAGGSAMLSGGLIRAERPSGKRPWVLRITPLQVQTEGLLTPEPCTVVFVHDLERRPIAPAQQLGRLFGLTAAESRLAVRLFEGRSLREAAELQEITYETARTHLRHILHKTETRGQSDLIRMLLEVPSPSPAMSRPPRS